MKTSGEMIKNGFRAMNEKPYKYIAIVSYVLIVLLISSGVSVATQVALIDITIKNCLLFIMLTFGSVLIVILLGFPKELWGYRTALERIGLKNKKGEIPLFVSWSIQGKKHIYIFESLGIPLNQWEEKQANIEVALNIFVEDIRYINGTKYIQITFVPATDGLPDIIYWSDKYLSPVMLEVAVGVGLSGLIYVNFAKTPHMLIGGSTGSGKTIELKNILYQLTGKTLLYVADFKGGVDFQENLWHHPSVTFITDKDKVIQSLDEILDLMEKRKQMLESVKASNIYEFNKRNETYVFPIVFACDEVAELLDKNGLSKTEKEKTIKIESKIAIIARLGRAFGIHLILATQRPDANVLNGQIKNNIDIRLCGRADQVLSMIVLDNTDATKIRKNQVGRFVMNDGTEIQGFWNEKL